jgi:hypothetical protein
MEKKRGCSVLGMAFFLVGFVGLKFSVFVFLYFLRRLKTLFLPYWLRRTLFQKTKQPRIFVFSKLRSRFSTNVVYLYFNREKTGNVCNLDKLSLLYRY